ncbi:hypothetical protein E2562_021709, partial [Oryza meyeriana var. granulata]
ARKEEIASGHYVRMFNNILIEGRIYTIHGVRFQPNTWEIEFRAIAGHYECVFARHTRVELYIPPLQFPLYPKYLMEFHDVKRRPNKTFVDIAGVLVYLGRVNRTGNGFYREATLMDTRRNLLVIGVYSNHLTRHVLEWASTKANNHIIMGTMLKLDIKYWCLESSDYTKFHFNPMHPATNELQ